MDQPHVVQLRTGELADRAGVTVRTLRYYDKIGLLKPSARSASGQRLYTEPDVARLQQILTLKLIGLSLDEIKYLLTSDVLEIQHLLDRQKHALEQTVQQLTQVIHTIEQAQASLNISQTLDLEQFVNIIRMVNMHNQSQSNWFDQFISEAQQAKLAQTAETQSLSDQKHTGEAWKALFEDIKAYQDKDIHDPEVQKLVDRWDALTIQFAGGVITLTASLNNAYLNINTLRGLESTPATLQNWVRDLQEAAAFIERARQAR
ncbi:MAG TPA: MerR family transcriptional regulator [Phototrophicaceae bacterium]|nr:MerR family transcriptional regulator [Phototrophicaceae bacterium]